MANLPELRFELAFDDSDLIVEPIEKMMRDIILYLTMHPIKDEASYTGDLDYSRIQDTLKSDFGDRYKNLWDYGPDSLPVDECDTIRDAAYYIASDIVSETFRAINRYNGADDRSDWW